MTKHEMECEIFNMSCVNTFLKKICKDIKQIVEEGNIIDD